MAINIGRRHFIFGLGGAAAWPLAVRAEQSTLPVIGWLNSGSAHDPFFAGLLTAYRAGFKDAGYVEGQNVEVDARWSEVSRAIAGSRRRIGRQAGRRNRCRWASGGSSRQGRD